MKWTFEEEVVVPLDGPYKIKKIRRIIGTKKKTIFDTIKIE